jgi:monoterpene epsilon-lactone hydrolase
VALINRLRDAKEELPAYAWLISPGSTLISLEQRLSAKPRGDPIIHKEYLDELVDAYLAPGMDRKDPRVSPLHADLAALHQR